MPVVFYAPPSGSQPLEREEMQQLFHDFNFKITPVPPRLAIALDHSDLYIGLANKIGGSELIRELGGMEKKAASLGKKSTAIVVQQNLVRFVRGASEGERFIESKTSAELADPHLTEDSLPNIEDQINRFLSALVEGMGVDTFKNRECMHLTAPGWGALGVIFNDLVYRLRVPDFEAAAKGVGQRIGWHRSATEWQEIVTERVDKAGNTFLGLARGGAQVRRYITSKARDVLGIAGRIEELEKESDLAA